MRLRFLLALALPILGFNAAEAQTDTLFYAPDTVCVRQPVQLSSNITGAASYYWSFCSGNILNPPTATSLGNGFGLSQPSDMIIVRQGPAFYGFVCNRGTRTLVRLNFGTSLENTPAAFSFGTLDTALPAAIASLYMVRDSGRYHLFAVGGSATQPSSLARIDFGTDINNPDPVCVNFGSFGNRLAQPRGIFVTKEGSDWLGFTINSAVDTEALVRFVFGSNVQTTPSASAIAPSSGRASDFAPIKGENDQWYFFATQEATGLLTRYEFNGPSLAAVPDTFHVEPFPTIVFSPTGITIAQDCGSRRAFITNRATSEVIRMDMATPEGPYSWNYTGVNFPEVVQPGGISAVVRDSADLFAFIPNLADGSLARMEFRSCSETEVTAPRPPVSSRANPPTYRYETPGTYQVYHVVNEGLPDARVECRNIVVVPTPGLTLDNDTSICQGDTVRLVVLSSSAYTFNWQPEYNLIYRDEGRNTIDVYPEFTHDYRVILRYPNGCVVDTGVLVTVSKNRADAGPDRTLADGASTSLGGPYTTQGPGYDYTWTPANFLNRDDVTNPVATPPYDFTYYLTVTNEAGCVDIDTVVVHTACTDLFMPNAFRPESNNPSSGRFGLLNKGIVKLNYFRVFDRWGQIVFSTTDATQEWDGRANGELVNMGVYVWEADGFCTNGTKIRKSGNVTVIR